MARDRDAALRERRAAIGRPRGGWEARISDLAVRLERSSSPPVE
jgi:hypothetical protein